MDEQKSKKKRRSGWDITPSNQSQQEVILQQQLALQKAQQLILQKTGFNIRPTVAATTSNPVSIVENRIYVGALNYDLGEREVRNMFNKFGTITRFDMSHDGTTMRSKGYCFIEFSSKEEADAAIKAMNGYEVLGRKIKVNRPSPGAVPIGGTQPLSNQPTTTSNQQFYSNASEKPTELKFVTIRNIRIEFSISDVRAVFDSFGTIINIDTIPNNAFSSSTQSAAIEFSTVSSAEDAVSCMNLFDFGGLPLIVETTTINPFPNQSIKSDSPIKEVDKNTTVLLENMITIEDLSDPYLKDEILEEASKYGLCKDIKFIQLSSTAHVKLIYHENSEATRAMTALDGRNFAGNKIKAYLLQE
eukprot:gene17711-23303_t